MVVRFAAAVALAFLSSACAYRTRGAAQPAQLDYSDYANYDQPFAQSPTRLAPVEAQTESLPQQGTARSAVRDNALGLAASADAEGSVTAEAASTEYEEVEATPGTPCYDAALKAGIVSGTCTLIVERKYLLVGEKAR